MTSTRRHPSSLGPAAPRALRSDVLARVRGELEGLAQRQPLLRGLGDPKSKAGEAWSALWGQLKAEQLDVDRVLEGLGAVAAALEQSPEAKSNPILKTVRQLRLAQQHLKHVDFSPAQRAVKSFGQPSISAEERRQLLTEAVGDKLTKSVHHLAEGVSEMLPPDAAALAARRLEGAREDGPPSPLSSMARRIDDALRMSTGHRGEAYVGEELAVVRMVIAAEVDVLSRIAVEIQPGQWPQVGRAAAAWVTGLVQVLLGDALPKADVERFLSTLGDLVATSVEQLGTDTAPQSLWNEGPQKARLLEAVKALPQLDQLTEALSARAKHLGSPLAMLEDGDIQKGIQGLNRQLLSSLEPLVKATPDAKAALQELGLDLAAIGNYAFYGARLARAISNDQLSPEEQRKRVKSAAEGLGPLFIKLVQTVMTFKPLAQSLAEKGDQVLQGPVVEGLSALQDQVSPMSEEAVRAEVRRSLGKEIEEAFVEFHMKDPEVLIERPELADGALPVPLAAASISQVHRAVIEVPATRFSKAKRVEVAVKVRRDDLDASFNRDVRVTRLAVGMLQETLPKLIDNPTLAPYVPAFSRLLEGTLNVLVDSFRSEKDLASEVKQMKAYERREAATPGVVVPKVYESHSGEGVITMQFLRGEKLENWLKRCEVAQEARSAPLKYLDLAPLAPREKAERVAKNWAVCAYGLTPSAISVKPGAAPGDLDFTFEFHNKVHRRGSVTVNASTLKSTTTDKLPDLSRENVTKVQKRLLAMFGAQGLSGKMHGDPHGGNLLMLGDGKTLGVLDFGQMVNFESGQRKAPWSFVKGMIGDAISSAGGKEDQLKAVQRTTRWLGDRLGTDAASTLGTAWVDMSEQRSTLTARARSELISKLARAIPLEAETISALARKTEQGPASGGNLAEVNAGALSALKDPRAASTLALAAAVCALREGLFPTSEYFHALKSLVAMAGNVMSFSSALYDASSERGKGEQLARLMARQMPAATAGVAASKLGRLTGTGVVTRRLNARKADQLSRP